MNDNPSPGAMGYCGNHFHVRCLWCKEREEIPTRVVQNAVEWLRLKGWTSRLATNPMGWLCPACRTFAESLPGKTT